jgi:hypothetical protein
MVLAVLQIAELPVSVILQGDGVTHLHAGLDNLEQVVRLNVRMSAATASALASLM